MNKQDKEIKAEEMETISGGPDYRDSEQEGGMKDANIG